MSAYCGHVTDHYASQWQNQPRLRCWDKGPINELCSDFKVLEFPPTSSRDMWTYATCCMSDEHDADACELHLFSPVETSLHVELLTVLAHYHRTEERIGLGHTVNFGRPWLPGSCCDHGLVSRPYLDGPTLETLNRAGAAARVNFYWLIPITKAEREFKKMHGLEALEERLEASTFNYLDPTRLSVV